MPRRTNKTPRRPKQSKSEVKSLIVTATPNANSGGVIQLLSAVVRGTTENTRVGSQLRTRALELSGFCAVTPATGVDQIHRLMIVRDFAPNGATPTLGDILSATSVYSFVNENSLWRFHVYYDHCFDLSATAESGSIASFRKKIKLGYVVQYNANALGDIRDCDSGALFIVIIGTSAAGVTAGSCNYSARLTYTDE